MAPVTLDSRFTLSEAKSSDMDEIWRVMEVAYSKDHIWEAAVANTPIDVIHKWFMQALAPRWTLPDITTFKIVENSSGRIAAWTALQFPWKDRVEKDIEMTVDMKAMVLSHDPPPGIPETIFMPAFVAFAEMLNHSFTLGYDPEADYHRKGTMVHPDFQKLGLGSALTRHTNSITQEKGGRTWAPARPSSVKMFRDLGFKDIGIHDGHAEQWGGSAELGKTFIVRRDD